MIPVTQETVLKAIGLKTVNFSDLQYHFILDEERQYQRLEKTLEKLVMQRKVEVIKEGSQDSIAIAAMFGRITGSLFRFYRFRRISE